MRRAAGRRRSDDAVPSPSRSPRRGRAGGLGQSAGFCCRRVWSTGVVRVRLEHNTHLMTNDFSILDGTARFSSVAAPSEAARPCPLDRVSRNEPNLVPAWVGVLGQVDAGRAEGGPQRLSLKAGRPGRAYGGKAGGALARCADVWSFRLGGAGPTRQSSQPPPQRDRCLRGVGPDWY